jgi:DNA-binding response OmpR family regulator
MTILLVEDDSEFAQDLLALWHPTGAVRRAATVEEATRCLEEWVPDLVLLDLCLPKSEEDGLGLLSLIRREKGWTTPVIVMTGSASAEARRRARDLRADAYLRKPVDVEELGRIVKSLLPEGGGREH